MNPHHTFAVFILAINGIYLAHDGLNRAAAELVTKDIDADLLVGRPVGADRVNDAVGGVTVTEWPPCAHRIADRVAPARCIRDPLARVLLEHVAAIIVHDLQTLHLRIHVQRFVELVDGTLPVELLHTPRRIDDEYYVFAIHRNAGDRVVISSTIVWRQSAHLVGQLLLGTFEVTFVKRRFGVPLRRSILTLYRIEFALQSGQAQFA